MKGMWDKKFSNENFILSQEKKWKNFSPSKLHRDKIIRSTFKSKWFLSCLNVKVSKVPSNNHINDMTLFFCLFFIGFFLNKRIIVEWELTFQLLLAILGYCLCQILAGMIAKIALWKKYLSNILTFYVPLNVTLNSSILGKMCWIKLHSNNLFQIDW